MGKCGGGEMGSREPVLSQLSDSVPPPSGEARENDRNRSGGGESEKKPTPLNILGSVRERGFSTPHSAREKVTLPPLRVTPFPVARHRSDGPHWGPQQRSVFSVTAQHSGVEENGEVSAAFSAEPLRRRQDRSSQTSQWRSNRKSELGTNAQIQNVHDDNRQAKNTESGGIVAETKDSKVGNGNLSAGQYVSGNLGRPVQEVSSKSLVPDAKFLLETRTSPGAVLEKLRNDTPNPLRSRTTSLDARKEIEGDEFGVMKQGRQSKPMSSTDPDIDAQNRQKLSAMTSEEIVEAQAELTKRVSPELLELLRRRGAQKEKKRAEETTRTAELSQQKVEANDIPGNRHNVEPVTSSPASHATAVSTPSDDFKSSTNIETEVKDHRSPNNRIVSDSVDIVKGTKVGPADLLAAAGGSYSEEPLDAKVEESSPPVPSTDPWTIRVEAVRMMKFDLNGIPFAATIVSGNDLEEQAQEGIISKQEQNILSVVERDYLRMDGDPVGSGYSLKEALALVRSTVPGQRAVALRLVASVLDNAMNGLQCQKQCLSSQNNHGAIEGSVDWQAIWAYALGPEAELVLTLRLALDDAHSTVIAASARAIQALLSHSVNESYFDSLEALWPGDKAVYTAPIFRRNSKHIEGFIGGGRWKYNVKNSEMFPFLDRSGDDGSAEDNENDTVADDGHVSNKDVAAGLIRMGILPRIRYILEVDKLVVAEEALLNILICVARHSPTGANAVVKCPRLIDAILQRFIGTEGNFPHESWSARLKAVRLLKIISQARRINCVEFEEHGVLQTVIRPLLHQVYVNKPRGHTMDLKYGFTETMIEIVRFWRVCLQYRISVALFSECYSTLCYWLLPLNFEEIVTLGGDEPLSLAVESYLLLEQMARTLPVLHAKLGSIEALEQKDSVTWSWGIAMAVLETAMQWLSPGCVAGVHELIEQCLQMSQLHSKEISVLTKQTKTVIGVVAAVLHFLATVCEKIESEKDATNDPIESPLPWIPSFIPKLGLALAQSVVLKFPWNGYKSKVPVLRLENMRSLVGSLSLFKNVADPDSALVALNCLNAIVRVSSEVDRLISMAKSTGTPSHLDQSEAEKILNHGLLQSSEQDLRNVLVSCKKDVVTTRQILEMTARGGPAPGLGVGWGSLCGGAWSKEVIIAQTSAKLAVDLMSIISQTGAPSHLQFTGEKVKEGCQAGEPCCDSDLFSADPRVKIDFGLAAVAISTNLSRDLIRQVGSKIIFHPSVLSIFLQKIEEVLRGSTPAKNAANDLNKVRLAKDLNQDPESLSRVLLQHCDSYWLAVKETKRPHPHKAGNGRSSEKKKHRARPTLAPIEELPNRDSVSPPESLIKEWVGQRLPPPSHWFLSPMVINLVESSTTDAELGLESASEQTLQLEKAIKAGLAYFLGFELLEANKPQNNLENREVALVRKIHSLSTMFVLGGDVYLHPVAAEEIRALQGHFGDEIWKQSQKLLEDGTEHISSTVDKRHVAFDGSKDSTIISGHGEKESGDVRYNESTDPAKSLFLDFEGAIDASYVNYAEIIAEQFVATSFGDLMFARQVALHMCVYVPHMIRLAAWRVLSDGRVLELLPRLSECCGPPQIYLFPLEDNQQMLESFSSAWSSGALDKAAIRDSLPFTLALHHLAGFLFAESGSDEIVLLKLKTLRTLVRSAVRKSDRQKMLARLVWYLPIYTTRGKLTTEHSVEESAEQVKSRISFVLKACEGDRFLVDEVQRLQSAFPKSTGVTSSNVL